MNSFKKISIVLGTAAALSGLSFTATAATKTDAGYLADCKASVHAQFNNVQRIDVANISSRRNLFKAKMRVKADGERSLVACEIRGDEPLALNCLKGDSCKVGSVASK